VALMLDETIISETPLLSYSYSPIGQQWCVPITGSHAHRIIHGVINVWSGEVILLITNVWDQITHQAFLQLIRSHWRGWHIVLFEDRGSPHTADESVALAAALDMQIRWLPRATSELNAMDQLWRQTKPNALANRATLSIADSAMQLCDHIYALSLHERLRKAGVLSGHFWLAR
jgi:transposase